MYDKHVNLEGNFANAIPKPTSVHLIKNRLFNRRNVKN